MLSHIKCEFCGKEVTNKGFYRHTIKNHSEIFESTAQLRLYTFKIRFCKSDEDVLNILEEYTYSSLLSIHEKHNIPYRALQDFLDACEIPIRSLSETALLTSVRDKAAFALNEKYGVDNASKSKEVKEKKEQTFIKNYGVNNIFKYPDFISSLNQKMLDKYGAKRISNGIKLSQILKTKSLEWYEQRSNKLRLTKQAWSEEKKKSVRDKFNATTKKNWELLSDEAKTERVKRLHYNFQSKLETRVIKILNLMQINYAYQYFIKYRPYDFLIGKVVLEINGDYWHANPKKYKAGDLLKFPRGKSYLAEYLWKKDSIKKRLAESQGYKVVYLWEDTMNKMTDADIENFIRDILDEACQN